MKPLALTIARRLTLRASLAVAVLLGAGLTVAACGEEDPVSGPCPAERLLAFEGNDYCIVIEQGFLTSDCPSDRRTARDFGDFVVCTAAASIPDEVESAARQAGLAPAQTDACSSNADCADGTVCLNGSCEQAPAACNADADCATGQVCIDGACEQEPTASCNADTDCATGERCDNGACATAPAACNADSDCASGQVCVDGACQQEPAATCNADSDCASGETCVDGACQAGSTGCNADSDCASGELCVAGECQAAPAGCKADSDCSAGSVCEPTGPVCSTDDMVCVPGCRADSDCHLSEYCAVVDCVTCPCPGICEPRGSSADCTSDADCPTGEVCEPTLGCGAQEQCVPGCHNDAQCGVDEVCIQPDCFTCPCPGYCETRGTTACTSDADCGVGTVCEPTGPSCSTDDMACIAGCHNDADCEPNEFCIQPDCLTCPCPGQCAPPSGGLPCSADADCGAGTVCEPAGPMCDTTSMICVTGCHTSDQCANGQTCIQPDCLTCPCPGSCG